MIKYKVPFSIEKKLKEQYSNIDVGKFINDLFNLIHEKSISEGSCLIYNFGRFFSYKHFSNTKCKFQPRFKFKVSRALIKKMCDDPYILDQISLTSATIFDKEKLKNDDYKKNRERSQALQNLIKNNSKIIREFERNYKMRDEISTIFEELSGESKSKNETSVE